MSNYNLTDNVNDSFEFELRGKKFQMKYPTTDELEKVQKLNQELVEADEAKDKARVDRANEQLEGTLYGFISPVGHDVTIKEALKAENIKVLKNFNTMIRTEISL
jgi:hypothetical protein